MDDIPFSEIDPSAFSDWTSSQRDTPACEDLVSLAAEVTPAKLKNLHKAFTKKSASWTTLDKDKSKGGEPFLAMMLALLASEKLRADAALVLLAALRCPGAAAHGVFHPIVFYELSKVLRVLLTGAGPAKGKGKKSRRAAAAAESDEDVEMADEDEEATASKAKPAATLAQKTLALEEINLLLQRVPLASHPEALAQFIALLASVGEYEALAHCCAGHHGEPDVTLPTIFRAVLPTLSLSADTELGAIAASGKGGGRVVASLKECEAFVSKVVHESVAVQEGASDEEASKRANAALQSVQALLQRASASSPGLSEPRSFVAGSLSRLLVSLPAAVASRYAAFLWKFARTSKVTSRTFAVEMAATTLQASLTPGNGRVSRQVFEDGTPQTLWRLLIQRLSTDKWAGVRAKALTCLAPLLSAMDDEAPTKDLLRIVQSPLPIANQAGYNQAGADEAGVARSSMGTTPGKTPNAGATPAAGVTPGAIVAVENTPLDGALLSAGRTSAVGAAGTPASGILSPAASLVDAASMDATLPALGEHLLLRVVDDKPAARRAALNALEGWAKASRTPLTSAIINTIRLRCKDTSPAIRKQAAKALNGLLTQDPSSTSIRSAWLQGVLPLLRDSELSVSEAALDSLHELILQPLARCSETPSRGFGTVSWQLLQRLTPESEPLLQHGVAALSRQKRLPASLAATAQAMLAPNASSDEVAQLWEAAAPAPAGANAFARSSLWAILLELAKQPQVENATEAQKLNPDELASCWNAACEQLTADIDEAAFGQAADEAAFSLGVLTCLAKRGELPTALASSIGESVQTLLFRLDAPPRLLVPLVQGSAALIQNGGGLNFAWASKLVNECERILNEPPPELPSPPAADAATTDGEQPAATREALLGFSPREEETTATTMTEAEATDELHAAIAKRSACLVIVGELAVLVPSLLTPSLTATVQDLALVQAAADVAAAAAADANTETEEGTEGTEEAAAAPVPVTTAVTAAAADESPGMAAAKGALAATAFVTLGKFCLSSPDLTKRLLPVFVRELSSNRAAAVRNNVLICMHDLSKRHTSLIDRHVPAIARALGDASPLVRQHAMLLLSQLLLEDYIKWKPPLLRAFSIALVDKEPSLRAAAHGCLFDLLLPRSPLLGFNGLLPLLFSLNGCVHAPHHPAALPSVERSVVELPGEGEQRRRLAILRSLLSNMDDEHKLQITSKLCHDVLAAVPDGQLNLEDGHWVLADALMLLACKEIKLGATGTGGEDEGEAEPATAGGAAAAAKSKLLSAVARKAMVESIVPIVIELKRHLEGARSPLLKDVFLFLRELLRDHKAHLQVRTTHHTQTMHMPPPSSTSTADPHTPPLSLVNTHNRTSSRATASWRQRSSSTCASSPTSRRHAR